MHHHEQRVIGKGADAVRYQNHYPPRRLAQHNGERNLQRDGKKYQQKRVRILSYERAHLGVRPQNRLRAIAMRLPLFRAREVLEHAHARIMRGCVTN